MEDSVRAQLFRAGRSEGMRERWGAKGGPVISLLDSNL